MHTTAASRPSSNPLQPRQRATLRLLVASAALYGAISAYGAFDDAGMVATPPVEPDVVVPQVTLVIDVKPTDLPSRKPSISAARAVDDIERAEVVAAFPPPRLPDGTDDLPDDLNQSGAGEPALAVIAPSGAEIWVAAIPSPRRTSPLPAASRTRARSESADEDLSSARKRIFAGDR